MPIAVQDDLTSHRRPTRSLRWYLALPVLAFVVVAVVASAYIFMDFRSESLNEAAQEAEFAAHGAAGELDDTIDLLWTTVSTVAQNPGISALFDDPAAGAGCTLNFAGGFTERGSLNVFSDEGALACSSHDASSEVPAPMLEAEWLRAALAAPVLLAPVTDPVSGQPIAVAAGPTADGRGVVAAIVHLDVLGEAISAKYIGVDPLEVMFLNDEDEVVYRSATEGAEGAVGTSLADTAFAGGEGSGERADLDGITRLYEGAPAGNSGWIVYAGADKGAVLAASNRLFLRDAIIIALAVAAVIATAGVTNRTVVRPITSLAAGIRRVAAGDYGARLDDRLPAEFGDVARGFNQMAGSIEEQRATLVRHASTDQATGLLNRTGLQDAMAEHIAAGRPLACVYLTVLSFHEITSTFGYPAADAILGEIGDRLERAFPDSAIARIGGNAFAFGVDGPGGRLERVQHVVERARAALDPEVQVRGVPLRVEFLIGAATFPDHASEPDLLLRKAEAAARRGGERHVVFDPAQDEPRTNNLRLVTALHDAVVGEKLELHYQPLIDAAGMPQGAEALLRWRHEGEWISPAEFIPVAERSGVMLAVDRWVFREAVAQALRWQQAGTPLPIAVNVSIRSLEDLDFPDYVSEVLATAGLAAHLVTVEVTETAVMTLVGNALEVAQRLRALGLGIALDDFGVGHSPIQYLRWFPVSRIKLDLTLVRDLQQDSEVRPIVRALLEMARALDIETVGEGVEEVEQHRILREMGCDFTQGYLHARPMDAAAFDAWRATLPPA
ncbi:MAG: GGDEF domain-containing protein [Dehalococcoidia bacterium]